MRTRNTLANRDATRRRSRQHRCHARIKGRALIREWRAGQSRRRATQSRDARHGSIPRLLLLDAEPNSASATLVNDRSFELVADLLLLSDVYLGSGGNAPGLRGKHVSAVGSDVPAGSSRNVPRNPREAGLVAARLRGTSG